MRELYTATSEARFMPRQRWSIARPQEKTISRPLCDRLHPRHRPIESGSGEDLLEKIHTDADDDERGAFHDRYGSDYQQVKNQVNKTTKLKLKLAPGGGWAARI